MRLTPRKARREVAKTRAGLSFETRGICMCTVKRWQPPTPSTAADVSFGAGATVSWRSLPDGRLPRAAK